MEGAEHAMANALGRGAGKPSLGGIIQAHDC